jgi:hypothetical protein
MNRLGKINRELFALDVRRVPGVASLENLTFLAALDKHWPTIRGMLASKPKASLWGRLFEGGKLFSESAEAENVRLRAALKPFADAAARFAPYPGQMEEKEVNAFFTLAQLRAASAALTTAQPLQGDE